MRRTSRHAARDHDRTTRTHGHGHHGPHAPHESPWVVTVPLILLAIPSGLIGYFTVQPMLFGGLTSAVRWWWREALRWGWPRSPATHLAARWRSRLHGFTQVPFFLALAGFTLATYVYLFNPSVERTDQVGLF